MSEGAVWRPVTPEALPGQLAEWLGASPGLVRVAVDGPPCADPAGLADALADPLRAAGRPFVHVRADMFWRDASLRLEYGREDAESFASWLDHGSLQREVLRAARDHGRYLPSLRDPVSNRSTRAEPVALEPGTVLAVSGALLLGLGLDFDVTVHLLVSPAARSRRTPDAERWTLPAYAEYDGVVRPQELSDVVVKLDSVDHPAVSGLTIGTKHG